MKNKQIKWFSLLIIGFILSGCGFFSGNEKDVEETAEEPTEQVEETPVDTETDDDTDEEATSDEVNQAVEAWLPRLNNVVYSYEGTGNEYATYTWNPQFNQENYYQTATDNGGTTMVEIYEYSEDQIVRTFRAPETYYRDNFTAIGSFGEHAVEQIVLQAPIEVGTSWSTDESDFEITAVNHEIDVPAGAYTTIEVTNTFEDTIIKRYYAEDVGLVSEVSETEGMTIESNLETVETDTPELIPFTVYVPDDQAMGMDTVQAELTLNTNDPARVALAELLTGGNADYTDINILPEGTEINYLFLNDNQVVEADVSSEFTANMNAGSTGELFGIYTLVNTLTQYYGVDEVLLTVDGEPYEGAHMILQEGETLQFNDDMVN